MQKKYFVGANTASGYVNLMTNNLKDISNIYLVSGYSKAVKSKLMEVIAKYFAEACEVECIVSPFNIKHLDGVIIREKRFAIADIDAAPDVIGTKTIDADAFLNFEKLYCEKKHLDKLSLNASVAYNGLYEAYGVAKNIHDEWESIYNKNMDFDRLESYTGGVISELIDEKCGTSGAYCFERFFGASTVDGSVNYIENLTENLKKRYFIKGRPGTGKSTFLKKLTKAANSRGFKTEVYYCSFDKNSLDMVIVPELSFCVFDSTAPHEMFPSKKSDIVLDFYEESGLSGVDEKFEKELEMVAWKYKYKISEGLAHLRLGNLCMAEREYYLEQIADFEKVSKTADKIIRKISE